MQRTSFVGFIVIPDGVVMEPDRVCMITEWLEPTCYYDIQVFLSFANFYRHFISSYSCLAKPMTDMLKWRKNSHFLGPFPRTLAMKLSFAELRDAFTKAPIQVHFDPTKSVCLETNALGFATTGIISQELNKVYESAEGAVHGVKRN
jgi:hypothetical protein